MLLGFDASKNHILNDICILLTVLTKYHIHCSKCLGFKPHVKSLLGYIKNICKVEKMIYKSKGKYNLFKKKMGRSPDMART